MINTLGFCGYECNDCGKVCPTGAITYMPIERKREAIMGIAEIDRQICWPWAEKKPCLTCEEVCPVPEKAIELEDRPVVWNDGTSDIIKLPHVVKENCIGCGICENHCPVKPVRAVRIVYEGETRDGAVRGTPPRERRIDFTTSDPTYWK
jgi:ferredoxin